MSATSALGVRAPWRQRHPAPAPIEQLVGEASIEPSWQTEPGAGVMLVVDDPAAPIARSTARRFVSALEARRIGPPYACTGLIARERALGSLAPWLPGRRAQR